MNLKELFIKYGYSEEAYEKIKTNYAVGDLKNEQLALRLKENFATLKALGYTNTEIIKMTTISPRIYSLLASTLEDKFNFLLSLGYSKETAIHITKAFPIIYSNSTKTIRQKIDDFISLGYTQKEVLKMSKFSPQIYSYSVDNMI